MPRLAIIPCIVSFCIGVLVGWLGFYHYANYMFQQHPGFFQVVLERKIQKLNQ